MKSMTLILTAFLIGLTLAAKYDTIDLDKILNNDRVLNSYIKCMLEEGPCTPEGRDLKEKTPAALATSCADCTDNEKSLVRRASLFVMKNKPKQWSLLVKKYDPKGKYTDNFNKFLNAN